MRQTRPEIIANLSTGIASTLQTVDLLTMLSAGTHTSLSWVWYSRLLAVQCCITRDDYEEAHRILRATEVGMPDALGEFGMNPLAQLKQEILESLRATQAPTPDGTSYCYVPS